MTDPATWLCLAAPPLWLSMLVRCTALLGLAWLAHAALWRCGPECRRALWRAAAVGLILLLPAIWLLPPLHVAQATVAGGGPARAAGPAQEAAPETVTTRGGILLPTVLVAWAVGSLFLLGRLALGAHRVARIVCRSSAPPDRLRERCEALRLSSGCRAPVRLRITDDLNLPVLGGIVRPTILIPAAMCSGDPRVLHAALMHELRHVGPRDVAWGWLLHVIRALLWFHPLVWGVPSAHSMACELSCDRLAAPAVGGVRIYGGILAGMALEACRQAGTCAPHMAGRSEVGRRLAALRAPAPYAWLSRSFLAARWVVLPAVLLLVSSVAVGLAPGKVEEGAFATAPEELGLQGWAVAEARVTLTSPYPESYRGAGTDRMSVQYAVIELARQAGLGYNWDESYRNTDPLCRRWLKPDIVDVPFDDAMRRLLDPLGLSYRVVESSVLLGPT